jgi:hypothetical protein
MRSFPKVKCVGVDIRWSWPFSILSYIVSIHPIKELTEDKEEEEEEDV